MKTPGFDAADGSTTRLAASRCERGDLDQIALNLGKPQTRVDTLGRACGGATTGVIATLELFI
jgi:hypothetical protein